MNITYSEMKEEEIEHVLAFWASTPGVHLHENGEDTVTAISAYLKRNPNCSFVALDDNIIVGAVLSGHDGRRGFINHLGVREDYRRKGIATHLLELVQEAMVSNHIKKGALFVLNDNLEGQAFYKAIGWKQETIVECYSKFF